MKNKFSEKDFDTLTKVTAVIGKLTAASEIWKNIYLIPNSQFNRSLVLNICDDAFDSYKKQFEVIQNEEKQNVKKKLI